MSVTPFSRMSDAANKFESYAEAEELKENWFALNASHNLNESY